jgi:hypothetical protein
MAHVAAAVRVQNSKLLAVRRNGAAACRAAHAARVRANAAHGDLSYALERRLYGRCRA